jgi:hypothetical protein
MSDGLHGLCRECDRVFHKSVTKKAHIRLPINVNQDSDSRVLSSVQDSLRELIEDESLEMVSFGRLHDDPRFYIGGSRWDLNGYGEYVANVMTLLLHHIQKLLDDKRVTL